MQAYGVQRDQVVGAQTRLGNGPGYSVTATMPRDTTREQFRLMLQTLLVERFHLVLHHETKPFPGYELTVSPGGAKLKEVTVHEDTLTPEAIAEIARSTALQKDEKGFPALPPGLPWRFVSPHLGTVGMIRTRFHASIAKFLEVLPSMIIQSDQVPPALVPQPRVEDRTGLNGVYDFTLEFVGGMLLPAGSLAGALLANQSPGGGPPSVPAADDPTGGAGGPTLFAALEKQLGLTLKKMKDVQVDMIVVDHADKIPTDN
jgi:uncharacterized protein (TIGR03435 family)